MKRSIGFFILSVVIASSAIPAAASALSFNIWEGTVATSSYRNADGTLTTRTETCNVAGSCDLCDGLRVFQNIVHVLFQIAIPLSVVFIVYGGIRLMTSGGSEQGVSAAKEIVKSAIIGLAISLAAWMLVNVVISLIASSVYEGVDFSAWSRINCI